jgi:hypothetical protein
VIGLIFNFWGSDAVIYEQEFAGNSESVVWKYYPDEAGLNVNYDEVYFSYNNLGFSEMDDFMTNLGYLNVLSLLSSVFLAWKIKKVIDGSDDLEIVQKAGYAVSVLAILSVLYPVYGIPNALEDDWKEGAFDEGDGFDYDGGFIGEERIDDPEWGEIVFDSGPGMGWYILVLGGILGILIYICVKDLENLGPSRNPPIVKDSVVSNANIGAGSKSKSEELRDVQTLLDDGIIDDAEFKQMKKEILGK